VARNEGAADHGGVPDGPAEEDLLQGGLDPPRWRRRWESLSRGARRAVAVLAVLLLAAAVAVWLRDQAADRARAQRVDLVTTLDVWASSTSPPGGQVSFVVLVRNEGERPVSVISIDGEGPGLRLSMLDAGDRALPVGVWIEIPLSVRLTCGAGAPGDPAPLTAEVGVRRSDGGATSRRVDLEPAVLVLDVARTLCSVRPDLRDHELSGPVLRARQAPDVGGECESGLRGGRTP
jgi:hypothetical protein